jgi:hypothetical protein
MISNRSDISLALAVWVLHDDYDHMPGIKNYISATTLLKPIRHIVLPPRVPATQVELDVEDFVASAMGNALHDSIEKAWTHGHALALRKMGYPDTLIERIRVNPSDDEVRQDASIIPVYLEQRLFREFEGWTIGGKFDQVTDGMIQDTKSTSAYSWLLGSNDDNYKEQLSIYRWLDAAQPLPKIHEDFGRINFIFTDWQKMQAKSNPNYPQKRVEYKEIELFSVDEMSERIRYKLKLIERCKDAPEQSIPRCSDEDLWRSDPQFKYYSDPNKTSDGRSTKNFSDAK